MRDFAADPVTVRSNTVIVVIVAICLRLVGCGDNLPGNQPMGTFDAIPDAMDVMTWRDAERLWADAWCHYAERCFAEMFHEIFVDVATCAIQVTDQNCMNPYRADPCDSPYPMDRHDVLAKCYYEMIMLNCAATMAPSSCYMAFE